MKGQFAVGSSEVACCDRGLAVQGRVRRCFSVRHALCRNFTGLMQG